MNNLMTKILDVNNKLLEKYKNKKKVLKFYIYEYIDSVLKSLPTQTQGNKSQAID